MNPAASGELTADPVRELRRQFDASFALPAQRQRPDDVDLLAVRVGADRCAIRRDQIAGLARRPDLTAVPGQLPALLGIATLRAASVAVYDLAGLSGRTSATRCRWVVLTALDPTLALAFEQFDGYLRVPRSAAVQGPGDRAGDGHGAADSRPEPGLEMPFLRHDGTVIPVLDVPAIVGHIDDLIRLSPPPEEPRR